MSEGISGDPVAHVARVTLGGAELSGATVWARADYVTDQGYVTVLFDSQGPRWQAGTSAVLGIVRTSGGVHEIPVRIEEEVWHGEQHRTALLRLRIVGGDPWQQAEELLAPTGSSRADDV